MVKKVRKRDGSIVDFDKQKIRNAIGKAFDAVNEDKSDLDAITDEVVISLKKIVVESIVDIEKIQDIVEDILVKRDLTKVAKTYIIYREQHSEIRKIGFILSSNSMVDNYLNLMDWRVKENSNMSFSIQGLNNHLSSIISSNYWLNKIYPKGIRTAHERGELHIHDLGMLSAYCCGWDLKDLLVKGFKGVSAKVESKPPKHFRAALGQIVNFFYTLQGESAGAQAFSNFDTYLAPFIHYDGLSYDAVKQAMQEFIFNINVPTRVGFQTPFTNITMDMQVPKSLKDFPAIIGGKSTDKTLGEFQKEMNMINRAFAEVMMEGDAKGRIFTFPIPTYNITKDFDWEDKELEPVWEMSAKYGIPYFSNFVNSDMDPDDARSMCCRLRLDNRELERRGGGLFGANPLTGSIGVVTMNLPRIGYVSDNKKDFFAILKKNMDLARDSLVIKRKVLEKYTELGLYPYSKFYLQDIHKRFGNYWSNHFSTIGLVGMNECLINFMGENITSEKGQEFAKEVLEYMRERISEYQVETETMFNLEATPAEGTTHRLARLDKKEYPEIIVANESLYRKNNNLAPYYTNSSQLPVGHTEDVFEALDLQDDLQTKYTGGTVFHIFLGEKLPDIEAVKSLVRNVALNYKLPYYTLSPTFSVCPNHGYIRGEKYVCPECQAKCEVYSRIVGYIRPVQNWNDGKREEFKDRLTFQMIS